MNPILNLNFSKTNGIVSSKFNDKRDDFSFEIINFPFLNGDVSYSFSYCILILELNRFQQLKPICDC